MIQYLKVIKRLHLYSKFQTIAWDNILSLWKEFYNQRSRHELQALYINLVNNLDQESIDIIDKHIDIMFNRLPFPTKDYMIRTSSFFTNKDLSNIKYETLSQLEKKKIRQQFKLDSIHKLEASVFKYKCGLSFLPKKYIKSKLYRSNIIDIGAFYGDSTLIFNKFSPNSITAIEPNKANFHHLTKIIKSNKLEDTIQAINIAAGKEKAQLQMYFKYNKSPNHGASIVIKPKRHKVEEVQVLPIDSLKINNVSLIKIDTEGYEEQTIDGLIETITNNKPILLISIYHHAEEFFTIKTKIENLNLGYKFKIRNLNHKDLIQDIILICY